MFFVFAAHVSALNLGHLQGATSHFDLYSVFGNTHTHTHTRVVEYINQSHFVVKLQCYNITVY